MTTRIVSLKLEDDLNTALRRFTSVNVDELPVLSDDGAKLLGMLARKDTVAEYNRRVLAHRDAVAAHQ